MKAKVGISAKKEEEKIQSAKINFQNVHRDIPFYIEREMGRDLGMLLQYLSAETKMFKIAV